MVYCHECDKEIDTDYDVEHFDVDEKHLNMVEKEVEDDKI